MLRGSLWHHTGLSRQHARSITAVISSRSSPVKCMNQHLSASTRRHGRPRKTVANESTQSGTLESRQILEVKTDHSEICATTETLSDLAPEYSHERGRVAVPPRLPHPSSRNHNDLSSFLAYAARVGLDETTTTFKGTHYEYMVRESLAGLYFSLQRTGRANDLGIDLLGEWDLPRQLLTESALRVLVQCKAVKPTPSMVRELEGAYVGAPAGWRGQGVLALLVASKEATKGVRDAMQRSQWPMGIMQVTVEGEVKQFLWNAVAAEAGLEGLGVTVRYGESEGRSSSVLYSVEASKQHPPRDAPTMRGSIALTWLGKPLKTAQRSKIQG